LNALAEMSHSVGNEENTFLGRNYYIWVRWCPPACGITVRIAKRMMERKLGKRRSIRKNRDPGLMPGAKFAVEDQLTERGARGSVV
jgi:hypothetical protein